MIASEIQKSLERFRIPKAIQKQTGKERFNRIFRDVEELPISSNLTEDLTEALRLSQFLIVICSYRTSESDWVKREIETFLELHDYNKQLVLTVLVEGEPDEVIPESLWLPITGCLSQRRGRRNFLDLRHPCSAAITTTSSGEGRLSGEDVFLSKRL